MRRNRRKYDEPAMLSLRALIDDRRKSPCVDCGKSFPLVCMEFDHVRGRKRFNLAQARWRVFNRQQVIDEMNKCDVVCSNCHQIRTHTRRQN